MGIAWHGVELQAALADLGGHQQIGVLLDRRVDPHTRLEFTGHDEPLMELLQRCAQGHQMQVTHVGPVLYWGPPETTGKLATLARLRARDVERLPAAVRKKWQRRVARHWEPLDSPTEIVTRLLQEVDCRPVEGARLPHDLWRHAEFPPLSADELLTLVLVQFDFTFRIDRNGEQVRWEAIPAETRWRASYASPRTKPEFDWQSLQSQFPTLRWERQGNRVLLDGPYEAHEVVMRWTKSGQSSDSPRRSTPTDRRKGETRFTLEIQSQPLDAVLETIARQTQRELVWQTNTDRKQLVSLRVQSVTLAELLDAATRATPVKCEWDDSQLRVVDRTVP